VEDGKKVAAYVNWEGVEAFLGKPLEAPKPTVEDLLTRIRGNKEYPRFIGGLKSALAEIVEYGSDDTDLRDVFIDTIALLEKG
jgi:hypothetical protein